MAKKKLYRHTLKYWQWVAVYVAIAVVIYGIAYYFFLNKSDGYSHLSTNYQVISPTPTPVKIKGWKLYTDPNHFYGGVIFYYPPDWTIEGTNNGPGFVSADRKFEFNISGPYDSSDGTYAQLALQEEPGAQLISKSNTIFFGHPAVEQELRAPAYDTFWDDIDEHIGNVKTEVYSPDGAQHLRESTIVPGMTITDISNRTEAIKIFHEILSTFQFTHE